MAVLDEIDEKLLTLLKANARMPLSELARKLGLARSTVQARLQRLEDQDVIAGYGLRMGEGMGAAQIHATVLARLASNVMPEVMGELRKFPEIERASTASGRFDLVIELTVSSLDRLDEIIDALEAIEGFEESETLVHLSRRLDRKI